MQNFINLYFFRVGPQRQVQQQYIDEMEMNLLQHPFELYPHLEESINPEVLLLNRCLEEVVII